MRSVEKDNKIDIEILKDDVKGFKIEWLHLAYRQDLEKLEKKLTAGK